MCIIFKDYLEFLTNVEEKGSYMSCVCFKRLESLSLSPFPTVQSKSHYEGVRRAWRYEWNEQDIHVEGR